MLMQEVSSCFELHLVKTNHKVEMLSALLSHGFNALWWHFGIIPILVEPCVGCAGRAADQPRRLFEFNEHARFLSVIGPVEFPRAAIGFGSAMI